MTGSLRDTKTFFLLRSSSSCNEIWTAHLDANITEMKMARLWHAVSHPHIRRKSMLLMQWRFVGLFQIETYMEEPELSQGLWRVAPACYLCAKKLGDLEAIRLVSGLSKLCDPAASNILAQSSQERPLCMAFSVRRRDEENLWSSHMGSSRRCMGGRSSKSNLCFLGDEIVNKITIVVPERFGGIPAPVYPSAWSLKAHQSLKGNTRRGFGNRG